MKLVSSFPVPAAPDKVLASFLDPSTMQACIPGCEELTQVDDTHYQGSLVSEVAHVKFTARFTAEITSTSAPADTSEPAVVKAVLKGEDRRLGSTIKVDAVLTISPVADGNSSEVSYELELAMWGKLGRLGESVIRRRTMEVEKQFAEALSAVCSGQPVPQRPAKRTEKRQAAATPASSTSAPDAIAPTITAPTGERAREDYLILGLAVAAAFAYGVILGGRRRVGR